MNEPHDDAIDALLRRQFDGPVTDDGFSERIMQHLPSRRPRRTEWPLWVGVMLGAVTCGFCLANVPLLHTGWRDWLAGNISTSAIGMLLAMFAVSLLALGWSLVESGDR